MRVLITVFLLSTSNSLVAQGPPLVLPADVRGACDVILADTASYSRYGPFCRNDPLKLLGTPIPPPDTVLLLGRVCEATGPCAADSMASWRQALARARPIALAAMRLDSAEWDRLQSSTAKTLALSLDSLELRLIRGTRADDAARARDLVFSLQALQAATRFRVASTVDSVAARAERVLETKAWYGVRPGEFRAAAAPLRPSAVVDQRRALTESAVLWGVTDFLLDRAGAELQTFLLARASQRVCRDAQTGPLLVRTCRWLDQASVRGVFAPAMVQDAVRGDIIALPDSMLSRLAAAAHPGAATLAAFLRLIEWSLAPGTSPMVALAAVWSAMPRAGLPSRPTELAIYRLSLTFDLLLRLAEDPASLADAGWPDMVRTLAVNLGWQTVPTWGPVPDRPGTWPIDPRFLTEARRLLARADTLRTQLLAVATTDTSRTARDRYFALADQLVAAVDAGLHPRAREGLRRWRASTEYVVQVVGHLRDGEFVNVVVAASNLRRAMLEAPEADSTFIALTFLAEVAQARDAAGVTATLHRFADAMTTAPPKRSRHTRPVFGVNGYVGSQGGAEYGLGTAAELAGYAGLWVPVGLEWGPFWRPLGLPVSVFGQIVDLGTLASYRIGGTELEDDPNVTVRQVFSPGLFIIGSIPGGPFSVGLGGSWAPRLRTLTGSTDDQGVNALRAGIFVAVDIPLYRR